MKKIIAALVAVMMFVPAFSLAEEAAPAATDEPAAIEEVAKTEEEMGDELNAETEEGDWYELNEDSTVLTVRLPALADAEEGYEWSFESEDGSVELLTSETTTDADGDPVWVGSFHSTASADSTTGLFFKYAKGDAFPVFQCLLVTNLTADGKIAVESASVEDDSWVYVDEDGKTLYIGLDANATTGYSWSWTADPEDALSAVMDEYVQDEAEEGTEGVGGMWLGAFQAAEGKSGQVTLTLNYTQAGSENPTESNIVNLEIAEDGTITIDSVYDMMLLDEAE